MPVQPNRTVVAVVYDQLCTFEFGVATELFGLPRPELGVDWYRFEAVSIDPGPISGAGGITINAPTNLSVIETADTVILPGWRDPGEAPPRALLDAIRHAHANGARILSICSGVFVLAATGLLDGQAATTHWRYVDRLRAAHPAIDVQPDVLYVDNGSTLTSAGSAAGLDLGLHLIARDYGTAVANRVAKRLVVPTHRSGGQAQFIDRPDPSAPDAASVAPTTDWALAHLDQPLSVTMMARHASMSPRTFARRFRAEMGVPPHRWLTQQRVRAARHLLETSGASVDEVASRCGFGSTATLRHHFANETKTTPSRYRSEFGEAQDLGATTAQLTAQGV